MNHFYTILLRHPNKLIALFILITLALGNGITLLEVRNSFDGELPEDDAIVSQINSIKDIYGERSIIMVGLLSEDIYTPTELSRIQDWSEKIKEL